jgi:septum formation protein
MGARRLILASSSPRRRELLRGRGFAFDVVEPAIDESPLPEEEPGALVQRLALAKARSVAAFAPPESVVLGCDTIVVLEQRVLGKPLDAADAVEMLLAIAGRTHRVHTAFAALAPALAEERVGVETSRVTLRPVTRSEAERYAAGGEPLDKAGAYALQGEGGRFVTQVEGSRSNVIGLPLERVEPLLLALGVEPV